MKNIILIAALALAGCCNENGDNRSYEEAAYDESLKIAQKICEPSTVKHFEGTAAAYTLSVTCEDGKGMNNED